MRLTELAHQLVAAAIAPGDTVIDATAGNGYDTLFLTQQAGPNGCVYSFDIQDDALTTTYKRLRDDESVYVNISLHGVTGFTDHGDPLLATSAANPPITQVSLVKACHSTMAAHIRPDHHGNIAAAMFNLGYLPNGDYQVVTQTATTIAAIEVALDLLQPGAMLSVLGYAGHDGGSHEIDALRSFIQSTTRQTINWEEIGDDGRVDSPKLFIARRASV